MPRRRDIAKILCDAKLRKQLFVRTIIATQAREGVRTTRAQAEAAYEACQRRRRKQ